MEMYTPSFSQKRTHTRRMKVMEHALGALEQKVIAMESLNEREQTMYDDDEAGTRLNSYKTRWTI